MDDRMNNTALCLGASFPSGPVTEIMCFLFGERRSLAFAKYLRRVLPGRDDCLEMLEMAWSRKNGFHGLPEPDEPDSEEPNWVYAVPQEGFYLEADSCSRCGNYRFSRTMILKGLCRRARCDCR